MMCHIPGRSNHILFAWEISSVGGQDNQSDSREDTGHIWGRQQWHPLVLRCINISYNDTTHINAPNGHRDIWFPMVDISSQIDTDIHHKKTLFSLSDKK